ncbi:GNAT family N-acetyltransferase [Epibacterium sp. MM17-32]|uniref:GNAT family N-acetyltransferase n=1 Tax=Epibacterium sp. MM17-32 TaxID=2917734 RepID=UPI001EF4D779|nr:GNAT family N-acetyltransferase [Epibacterium sp. MM17-32]MCG7627452.1 GNAT family N-acetyltransferase [Epibacterium sp. MM17-32]
MRYPSGDHAEPRGFTLQQIKTQRLNLRLARRDDATALAEVRSKNHAELWPWFHQEMGTTAEEASPDWQRQRLTRDIDAFNRRQRLPYIIWQQTQLIGRIDVIPHWHEARFRLAYWVSNTHQAKGYGSEAVTAVTQMAFRALGAQRVTTGHAAPNRASAALARRLGFQPYGRQPNACLLPDGSRVDGLGYERRDPERLPEVGVRWR